MSHDPAIERPARRLLHVCYCCADDQQVAAFFVDGLDFRQIMRTTDEYTSGELLGIPYDVHSIGNFVYDRRGPRTSPAIEVQGWYDPTPVGEPSTDPFEAGIKAIGVAVPSVDAAVARLMAMGCTVVADGPSPFDQRQVTLLDSRRVTLELVEEPSVPTGETRLHHLRITVRDLARSIEFYDALGFDGIGRGTIDDASFVGHDGTSGDTVDGEYVVLRLPDEPTTLRLVEWRTPESHGSNYAEPYHAGLYRAALAVDDTRASYEHMSAAGAVFDRPPMPVVLSGTPVPDMWITFISDPDGIPWEFVQRPRSAFR